MLEELKTAPKVVGVKQLQKALSAGTARKVFLASDADPMLTEPLADRCRAMGVELEYVPSMKQLGLACGISVKAAAAALI